MKTKRKLLVAGALVAATAAVGSGVAYAAAGQDGPIPTITGAELDRAERAALDHVGDGRVTETEADDDADRGAYEVEITRADGTEVDVDLDRSFRVLHQEIDRPDGPDDDGPHDD